MSTRFRATDRLTRLLAIIPHVAGRGFVPLDDMATRFSYPRDELVADLTQVLPFVGVAPFTPDTLIEVTVDDERMRIDYADWFSRPLRLSAEEALALLAAGRTLLGVDREDDASGPLLRGLAKLRAALGAGDDGTLAIHLGTAAEETLSLLRTAVAEHRQVRLDYYSYGRDRRTVRVIEPRRFFADEGNWYVAAFCHLAGADRVFRVDRIREAVLLDTTFAAPTETTGAASFAPSPGDPRVVLDLEQDARWVVDHYPHDALEELGGGRVRVTLPVTARPWLERLLVRLGPSATVVTIDDVLGDDPRSQAARRILARYQASDAATSTGQ
jgi:proteasome accessory factor C